MANFQNSDAASASLPEPLNFEREDWTLFRTLEGLQQRAGVEAPMLRRLALKEIADNGLDLGAKVETEDLGDGAFRISDDGPGIDPDRVPRLFSINRKMETTKLLRLPTRGALGNGLRVVAGCVLVSGGSLVVTTRNRRLELHPERDGTTTVVSDKAAKFPKGTRIDIRFGPGLPDDRGDAALAWAELACKRAAGPAYLGKSSPWWYDAATFHELLYSSGDRPVRDLIAALDGYSGGKAGEIVSAARLDRARCRDLTLPQATRLLEEARDQTRPVQPERLGSVGDRFTSAYAVSYGEVHFGMVEPLAEIPFVVEAWAHKWDEDRSWITAYVNRTPTTSEVRAARDKRDIDAFGCGLHHTVAKAPSDAQFSVHFNIITPFMPITSDGKAPNLEPFRNAIASAVGKAVGRAYRPQAASGVNQKSVCLDNLDDVIANVSGDGRFKFNQRQLFYGLRPIVRNELDQELKLGNFVKIIDEYEAENGPIPGMYREPRGSIYHPHTGETITLGDLMVETYERPLWTFNKLLYIEKEGFSEALKDERWGERHDCALVSSKGYTTRAAKDLVDKLAAHDEPVTIFCVHDADAYGTMIMQTFQEATRARGARKIRIVNLGLEPWEAIARGLEVEDVEEGERHKAVADYVHAHPEPSEAPDSDDWEEWLQTHRVELNAMTTPAFIAWLDGKMADYDKLIPPAEVIAAELDAKLEERVRAELTERILREGGFEDRVAGVLAGVRHPSAKTLTEGIGKLFAEDQAAWWRDHIATVVAAMQLPD